MPETLPPTQIPTDDDLRRIINESSLFNTSYPELVIQVLNERAPVLGQLTVTDVPKGFAPQSVRREWVGLSLPVRCDGVAYANDYPVLAIEAMQALKEAGKDYAHGFWQAMYDAEWEKAPGHRSTFPSYLAYTEFLIFSEECGQMEWGSQKTG